MSLQVPAVSTSRGEMGGEDDGVLDTTVKNETRGGCVVSKRKERTRVSRGA